MNKKICFVTLGNLYLCPYLSKYTSIINFDYDVIYWDRHGMNESIANVKTYAFDYKMEENLGKINKIQGYIKFSIFANNIIKRNNYSALVLLQTSISILLTNILFSKYRKKYIVDIRDYTMEHNKIFYNFLKIIINNSAHTVISSEGYRNFLPEYNYTVVHNDIYIDENDLKKFAIRERKHDKIIISYIGLIRFHEQNKKILLKFKNDDRYMLRFIGKGASYLKDFCIDNDINNVELVDYFPPDKTLESYYDTDIIYNLYGNNNPLLDYALSNKLYYAAKLKIPILVCPNTFMEEISVNNGFGLVFDTEDPNALNTLHESFYSIDWNELGVKCDLFLDNVSRENSIFNDTVNNFIRKYS